MIPCQPLSLVFIEAGQLKKGMVAHEKALEWQELFDIAVRENVSEEDTVDMGYRVAGVLFFDDLK
jgi:elongator complex protein 1